MEGGSHGNRVNALDQVLMVTASSKGRMVPPDWAEAMFGTNIRDRPGVATDIVHAAIHLASNEARWVSGARFEIDGGTTCMVRSLLGQLRWRGGSRPG